LLCALWKHYPDDSAPSNRAPTVDGPFALGIGDPAHAGSTGSHARRLRTFRAGSRETCYAHAGYRTQRKNL